MFVLSSTTAARALNARFTIGRITTTRSSSKVVVVAERASFTPITHVIKLRRRRQEREQQLLKQQQQQQQQHYGSSSSIKEFHIDNRRGSKMMKCHATRDDGDEVPFGYTRLDVLLIGGGVTAAGFAAYYGLQEFAGFDAQWAGNVVQLTFVMALTLLWVGSYVQRVFNKDMTYGKQLKDYEEAVMQKRLEEMPESELMTLMEESERQKGKK
jgi:hypothetical protein